MANIISSSGDPIFYLHHAFLDKLFWNWQQLDLPPRYWNMGGPNINDMCTRMREENSPGAWGPPCPGPRMDVLARIGDWGPETTLEHLLFVFNILPNVTIMDVMDIEGGTPLCYEYI
jgi:tyrosinase